MAGRNISVEREALGSIRVMKTIGMMGGTIGRAAALCITSEATPREIFQQTSRRGEDALENARQESF